MNPKAIVIGSGVAGLACAIRLAVQGMEVNVYEKNARAGGKIAHFEKDGFLFDTGPSLFTQPENIIDLFKLADEPINEYFSFIPVKSSCKYFYENGRVINAYSDRQLFEEELVAIGEPGGNLGRYLKRSEKLYHKVGAVFLDHSLHKRRTWLHSRVLKAISAARFPYLFKTLAGYNSKNFSTKETQQLFNRYATYNGSDPYRAPGMLSLIPHLEQNEGIFYPKGGMISIADALYKLAVKKGVNFYFGQPVTAIIHNEGRVRGIVSGSENITADVVVSNADVYFTHKLVGNDSRAARLLKQERSSSAIIFYWGMAENDLPLELHNIIFSKNYQEEFTGIFKIKKPSNDPTIYINITSKIESGHAPTSKQNWFVMVNVPANIGQDWEKIRAELRKNIILKLNRVLHTDIEALIETEHVADPVSIEEASGSFMGSLYGSSSNSRMAAFKRHANFTAYVKGLYFCGGSVHPGGGIPLCFRSAKITAGLIMDDLHKRKAHH